MKQADADRVTIEDAHQLRTASGSLVQQRLASLEAALKASEAARQIAEERIIAGDNASAGALAAVQADMFLQRQVGWAPLPGPGFNEVFCGAS
jgi:hypothetical protein